MKPRTAIVALLMSLAPVPAIAQEAAPDAARAALLKADADWAALVSTKDIERIVAIWTDDAVIYSPREAPVRGKAAIRAYVGESLKQPGFSIAWTPATAVVAASGDLGYTEGTNQFTVPDGKGGTSTIRGRYLTIWRKQPDGTWRCVVDFWNEAPSAEQK